MEDWSSVGFGGSGARSATPIAARREEPIVADSGVARRQVGMAES